MMSEKDFKSVFPYAKKCKSPTERVTYIRKVLTKGYAFMYSGKEYDRKMQEALDRAHELHQHFCK